MEYTTIQNWRPVPVFAQKQIIGVILVGEVNSKLVATCLVAGKIMSAGTTPNCLIKTQDDYHYNLGTPHPDEYKTHADPTARFLSYFN